MSVCEKEAKDTAYRVYVAEALRIISENTARQYGGQYVQKRLQDILTPRREDTRSGEEIVADVLKKGGLTVKRREE